MIGGLPAAKTDLHAQITGKIQMDGFSIEKLILQSLPEVYVTALVYLPDDRSKKHPAVLVRAGHAADGKFHYQALSQRLVGRGYVVISWDAVGQGERSQFWYATAGKSRYNLICGEHAVMGNLAYLAGANLARWEIWDGIRAVDYLLTRPEVDAERISITGTSGGGFQTALIAALDERIKVAVPSCYITAMPMRIGNRIFADPDSDPEQDLFGMISNGLDHPGLLLLMYPRPVLVAAAVVEFFPTYGTRYSGVGRWDVSEYSGGPAGEGKITWDAVGSSVSNGISIDRYMLRHSRVLEMPLLHIHKADTEKRPVLLWFRENGKATAADWPEIKKFVAGGYDVISFDVRGLGETRMPYTAVSPDDPELGALDFDHAYVNPISGVLANHVYNSLLVGRPYFLQMMEDAEIASRFAGEKLGAKVTAVSGRGDAYTLAVAISETLRGAKLLPGPDARSLKWSEIVEEKRETWPIQYLLPSGAYIH